MTFNQLKNKDPKEVVRCLKETPIEDELEKDLAFFENVFDVALKVNNDDFDPNAIKVGTVLVFEILNRLKDGKIPAKYDKEDWREVTNSVIDISVIQDGESYTEYVFDLFSKFLDESLSAFGVNASKDTKEAIKALSKELTSKTKAWKAEEITEAQYIEDCMYICLDAMMKLIAAFASSKIKLEGVDTDKLALAASSVAFQYIRCSLFQQEQAVLDEIIVDQYQVDTELAATYNAFLDEFNERTEKINELLDNAFNADFRKSLKETIDIPIIFDVPEDELLITTEDVDKYFM